MNDNENALAKCPYYVALVPDSTIRCESCAKPARLCLAFGRREDMITYKRRYCDSHDWEQCGYARLMVAGWELQHGKI